MVGTVSLDQSLKKECQVVQHAHRCAVFLGLGGIKPVWRKGGSEMVTNGSEVCILGR